VEDFIAGSGAKNEASNAAAGAIKKILQGSSKRQILKSGKSVTWLSRTFSDAHGHDDVAIAVGFIGKGAQLASRLFILEFDADRPVGRGG
jgi:hypothetical protein